MLAALLLAFSLDPVNLTSELHRAELRPGGDVLWVVRIEWEGPEELEIESVPEPVVQNLRVIGVRRETRSVLRGGARSSAIEIGYHLTPVRPGYAAIRPSRYVCGLHGTAQVLTTKELGFEIEDVEEGSHRLLWMLLGAAVLVLASGSYLGLRHRRSCRVPAVRPDEAAVKRSQVILETLESLNIEELVRVSEKLGIGVSPDVLHAIEAYKFAREDPAPDLVTVLRDRIRRALAAKD